MMHGQKNILYNYCLLNRYKCTVLYQSVDYNLV